MRNVQVFCPSCSFEFELMCEVDQEVLCSSCGSKAEQQWWLRRAQLSTQWHPSEWATVFKRLDAPEGSSPYSFPARSDKPTPPNCERITIKSDSEMAQIERAAHVVSERRWFDSGSGRGGEESNIRSKTVRR